MSLRLKVLLLVSVSVLGLISSLFHYPRIFLIVGILMVAVVMVSFEYWVLRRIRLMASTMATITDNKDLSLRITAKGTDELSKLNQQFNQMMFALENSQLTIKHQALHDSLTGLPNRVYLYEDLHRAIYLARQPQHTPTQVAVLFIDLDNFKNVNDTLGHNMGDQLLVQFTHRLMKCVSGRGMLSRLGGDEFCLITSFTEGTDHLDQLIRNIEETVSEPFQLEENFASVSTSIGVSLYPQDGHDPQTLLRKADMAMFRIKEAGKNSHQYYTEDMEKSFSRKILLEQYIKKAITRNELYLHYQPKIDIFTHRIVGVEALLRWKNPIHGIVSPAEFIPIAESTGLIAHIGEWVIREVCRQHNAWKLKGFPEIHISVNLSRIQLEQNDLVKNIQAILSDEKVEPRFLELEITENAAMKNVESLIEIFEALKETGVTLSIDNFGTGYSSLSYLKRFPIQSLKIDASFINDIGNQSGDERIVKAIIELGHNLNLKVIASGVETDTQLLFLQQLCCDEVQGYLIGKPLSPVEIEEIWIN
ncbi:MAG TPA: EAL domain-containing protein [Bacilli bacterium]